MIPLVRGPRLGVLFALVTASLGQVVCALGIAWCVQAVFDSGLVPRSGAAPFAVAPIVTLFTISVIAMGALEVFRSVMGARFGLGYVAELRASLFERVMLTSQSVRGQKQGGLLLPFVGDLAAIKNWVSDGVVRLISASITALLIVAVLISQNVALALAAGLVLVLAAAAIVGIGNPLDKAILDTRSNRAAVANFVSASFRAASTVQAFDRLDREAERLRRRSDALERSGVRLGMFAGLTTAVALCSGAALLAATLVIGTSGVRSGALSVGSVAAAISLMGLLSGSLRDLGLAFELWRRADASFKKVGEFLSLQASLTPADAPRRFRAGAGGLELRRIEVTGVLRKVNAVARQGEIINVIGDSGSGKSTLLALVAGLREPDAGRLRLDGNDLRRVSISALRRRVGVASAATPLMRGSIAMNLRYRAPSASQDEIDEVVRDCVLQPVFDRLREKDKTRLSEGASELSRGEVQRLQIARAMLGSPAVLVLDEVDTHLGPGVAQNIANVLRRYGGIVLMSATSPEFRDIATTTWRLENGRITIPTLEGTLPLATEDAG